MYADILPITFSVTINFTTHTHSPTHSFLLYVVYLQVSVDHGSTQLLILRISKQFVFSSYLSSPLFHFRKASFVIPLRLSIIVSFFSSYAITLPSYGSKSCNSCLGKFLITTTHYLFLQMLISFLAFLYYAV